MALSLRPLRDVVWLQLMAEGTELPAPIDSRDGNPVVSATILGAGPDTKLKKGDVVICRGFMSGERLDDGTRLTSVWDVLAVINKD